MSRTPFLSPSVASEVISLIAAAKVHAPGHELGWILGYCTRAAAEPVRHDTQPSQQAFPPRPLLDDPRREPPTEGELAQTLARVKLDRRPP